MVLGAFDDVWMRLVEDPDPRVRRVARRFVVHDIARQFHAWAHPELWFCFGRTRAYPFDAEGLPLVVWGVNDRDKYEVLVGAEREYYAHGDLDRVVDATVSPLVRIELASRLATSDA